MQANNDSQLLCVKGNPAVTVCTQKGCTSHPIMCKEENCSCLEPHPKHNHLRIRVFMERLREPPLSKEICELEKVMNSIITMMNHHMIGLKRKHEKLMELFISKHFKYYQLREQLLDKDKQSPENFTGDSAGQMVAELEKGEKVGNPYHATLPQLQQNLKSIDAELHFIVARVEMLWNFPYPVHLKTVHGKSDTFYLEPTQTVEMLKSRIHMREGLPVDQIRLSINGKELDGKKSLRDSNVGFDSQIYIGLKHRGLLTLFVNGKEGIGLTLKMESNDLVDKIRNKIHEREGIALQDIRLAFMGTVMENGRTLGDYHVKNESEIEVTIIKSSGG